LQHELEYRRAIKLAGAFGLFAFSAHNGKLKKVKCNLKLQISRKIRCKEGVGSQSVHFVG
jgi:hypothetical protein